MNLIKASLLNPSVEHIAEKKDFCMGHDLHSFHQRVQLTSLGQKHDFYEIPDDFPILEDGIIGLPYLDAHNFTITSKNLTISDLSIPLFSELAIPSKQTVSDTIETEAGTHRVLFINPLDSNIRIPTNEIVLEEETTPIANRFLQLTDNIRTEHLDTVACESIEKIIFLYSDIFSLKDDPLPKSKLTSHRITVNSDKPVFVKPYRLPKCHEKEVEKQVNKMLEEGIIEESYSDYNAPIHGVAKKPDANGLIKWRIVVDFRKLNELINLDAHPLPIIYNILGNLGKAKFIKYSCTPIQKNIPRFQPPDGHYQYTRMSFGLKNAPSTF